MSVREALNHAHFGVVQVEEKVHQLLTRAYDPSEDPFDLQDAAGKLGAEIENIGNSLLTRKFADPVFQGPSLEPTPEWIAYEELHKRLHDVKAALNRAQDIIRERFLKRDTAGLS